MSQLPNPPQRHSAWNIWANPIFRRYCQARLRMRGLGISALITILIATFIVSLAGAFGIRVHGASSDSARVAFYFLLILQGIILFILGTAQTSGGMVAERDEGMMDYQRLIPMSPLAKVIGYLFGLPIREYVLVGATLPFSAWCLWRGEVPWKVWAPLCTVFLTSALLYHCTGLVTGTVVKNRRWAFLVSIGLVFALYTIIPQVAKVGMVFFKYLTMWPVLEESYPSLLPKKAAAIAAAAQHFMPSAKFFNLNFSEWVFTIFSQGGLVLTFLVMLCRKWKEGESHLLGKLWATGFFIWVQTLLLGNALPLIEPGNIFPNWTYWFSNRKEEAVVMCGLYGVVTLSLLFILSGIITPSFDHQIRGWRSARKQNRSRLALLEDAATSYWFVAVMALAGAAGWYLFSRALVESHWFPGQILPHSVAALFAAVLLTGGIGFQALLEAKGGRVLALASIFVGVVPIMIGVVLGAISDNMTPIASWIAGISPGSMPIYAAAALLPISELPKSATVAVPQAFHTWLFVAALATLWLTANLRASRKKIAAKTASTAALPSC